MAFSAATAGLVEKQPPAKVASATTVARATPACCRVGPPLPTVQILDSSQRPRAGSHPTDWVDRTRPKHSVRSGEMDNASGIETPTPEQLLGRFGLRAFRPGQCEAVQAALEGRDSLVVMPTGGGKSLCYQLPALADLGLVVVVSPLIALMSDQWRRLQEAGVRASMLASGMEEGHNAQALREIESGATQLVLA